MGQKNGCEKWDRDKDDEKCFVCVRVSGLKMTKEGRELIGREFDELQDQNNENVKKRADLISLTFGCCI